MAYITPRWPDYVRAWKDLREWQTHVIVTAGSSTWQHVFNEHSFTKHEMIQVCHAAYETLVKRDAILRRITKRLKE